MVAIIQLSRILKKLCAKSMNSNEEAQLKANSIETMCMMEREMPPFFDIMSHMPNHLVEELFLCGPIHMR